MKTLCLIFCLGFLASRGLAESTAVLSGKLDELQPFVQNLKFEGLVQEDLVHKGGKGHLESGPQAKNEAEKKLTEGVCEQVNKLRDELAAKEGPDGSAKFLLEYGLEMLAEDRDPKTLETQFGKLTLTVWCVPSLTETLGASLPGTFLTDALQCSAVTRRWIPNGSMFSGQKGKALIAVQLKTASRTVVQTEVQKDPASIGIIALPVNESVRSTDFVLLGYDAVAIAANPTHPSDDCGYNGTTFASPPKCVLYAVEADSDIYTYWPKGGRMTFKKTYEEVDDALFMDPNGVALMPLGVAQHSDNKLLRVKLSGNGAAYRATTLTVERNLYPCIRAIRLLVSSDEGSAAAFKTFATSPDTRRILMESGGVVSFATPPKL